MKKNTNMTESDRLPGTSPAIRSDCVENDIQATIGELQRLGLKVESGDVSISNKPTINSNNGG